MEIAGEVFYLERIALPPDAVLRVSAQDVARADAAAMTLAEIELPATHGPPFPFTLRIARGHLTPQTRIAVRAQIQSGGRLRFTSTENHAVASDGSTPPLRIRVTAAGAQAP